MSNRPRIQRKPGETRLWVTMPYDPSKPASYNRTWLKSVLGARKSLVRNRPMKRWEIARPHLWVLASALAERFGEVEVLVEFNTTERCSGSCQTATNPVYDCVCACLGKYHGGGGRERIWVPVGPHRLISEDDGLVHFVVHRGDMPAAKASVPESAPPAPRPQPATESASAAVEPAGEEVEATPTNAPRPLPLPSSASPASSELPPGCGLAVGGFLIALFSLLALGISPWFWIGSIVVLLAGLAVIAEQHGL
ncbi:hypothetical protein [Nocardia grenadensis]|uniref:hypothetical protein n=1 Tax=Nocardia grenadensis TaxID=931537 RepID=UPI000A48598E|nr:hypothetical protein [Nocardia grenadensis]